MGYQLENIEHVGEQCSGSICSWEYYMVIVHKYFSCNAYTQIPIPEITMGSWVIRRILWFTPNNICNEWQVWVWLGMPRVMLSNMSEVRGLPLSRREMISPATWLVKLSSVWPHPNKMISVIIYLTESISLVDQGNDLAINKGDRVHALCLFMISKGKGLYKVVTGFADLYDWHSFKLG